MAFLLNAAYALIIWHNQKASTFLSCHRGIASARWSIGARLSQQKSGASIRRSFPHKPDCSQFTGLKHVFRQFQFHLDIEQRCLSIAQSGIFFLLSIFQANYICLSTENQAINVFQIFRSRFGRSRGPQKNKKYRSNQKTGSWNHFSKSPLCLIILAEWEGFEPSREFPPLSV